MSSIAQEPVRAAGKRHFLKGKVVVDKNGLAGKTEPNWSNKGAVFSEAGTWSVDLSKPSHFYESTSESFESVRTLWIPQSGISAAGEADPRGRWPGPFPS